MTAPKIRFDWTVSIQSIILIVSVAFSIIWTWQDNQRSLRDHESRLSTLEGDSRPIGARLAIIETQLKYTAEAVERIDRRTEARVGG